MTRHNKRVLGVQTMFQERQVFKTFHVLNDTSRFWNICDRAQQKGVQCLDRVSEKLSLEDEMFQK